ncbi:glycoside hydrolase family 88 protein [Bacteroides helcogenes]|uniref:Glycosyl hydrolase family 88 n=1 Tax=Bacteroides helcogenes (strain ATCC 35417 / DSM 20613 / JCM 6297 / CCUG 15421 / P 36-108) TaxID=693979 RepID=E6SRW5_BACT6|nr:glycoside hydrolase family 88 protein [Bacteroides helcogenes]ADV42124.1 glycosyl hydrolase family 88 [Bacteroides helcogenes P 36-108]MDY5240071.1 glycoside hydrolase family 88 protein [Bacteroides helcogenes]
MKKTLLRLRWLVLLLCYCSVSSSAQSWFVQKNVLHARQQLNLFLEQIPAGGTVCPNPVHIKTDGSTMFCSYRDWRSGFFPGTLWLAYEMSAEADLLEWARRYTESVRPAEQITDNHDIGFIVMCSFGNGLRLTGDSTYARTIITAARSLSTRFRPAAGIIQSWDVSSGWMSKRGWNCPVIIDNMMNLELLFKATELSGDSAYYKLAVKHADRTLKEHFRKDGSCYHVVDYDCRTGRVRSRVTAQGYADESVWSRGQAWAIYGYTVCYRETGDMRYLNQALKTFRFMKNHPAMPADAVPYWDLSVPDISKEPRDASAAACMAAALYELGTMRIKESEECREYADRIMQSLSSPAYRAGLGQNNFFLLRHSVGSIPHHAEVDVPLNYADYYYMEALKRKSVLEEMECGVERKNHGVHLR